MFKKKLEKIFILRHLLFFYYEFKRAIIYKKEYNIVHHIPFLQAMWLRFFSPYADLILKKLLKNKKECHFENSYSEHIFNYGYSILPDVDVENLDFVKIDIKKNLVRSNNVVQINKALEFAKQKGMLKIVKEYFKEDVCNFTSTSWNTRPFAEATGITKFHQDRDGYKILKIFIYLNDTFENSGPHVFAVGSHKKKFLKFIPQYRYDDYEVKKHYKELKTFCGKKGLCFAEDTTGLHRGTPPIDKTRSILEFTFYTGNIQWSNETVLINL